MNGVRIYYPQLVELRKMIDGTIAAFPILKERWKAMRAIRWRLRGPNGEFVGMRDLKCSFVPESEALVFDGRDNEEVKFRTYQSALGSLTVEILEQTK